MYTIYSKPDCSWCDKAKALLRAKELPYKEIVLDLGQERLDGVEYATIAELHQLVPGARTVPQILVDGVSIGGYEHLERSFQ
jgi:glutaredoxin 3